MSHCLRHYEEPPAGTCRSCKQPFCTRCLVWAFGPKKPPFCVACALSASGVRPSHRTVIGGGTAVEAPAPAVPTVDKRMARAERRAEREALKRAGRAERRHARRGGGGDDRGGGSGSDGHRTGDERVADLGAGSAPDSRVPAPSQLAAALRAASVPRGLMSAD